jgi:superfamily I DNA/RNA helicase/CRISPR/Cas system-associated exonuclease Cas4 (RecB family)
MSHWHSIRNEARTLRKTVLECAGIDPSSIIEPKRLTQLAADRLGVSLDAVRENSQVLQGSVAVLRDDVIYFNHNLDEGYKQYSIAHELGHHVLHRTPSDCSSSDIITMLPADEAPTPVDEVGGYGMHERREREANMFALELLIPCDALREAFEADPACVQSILSVTSLPRSLVMTQLSTAVLLPLSGPVGEAAESGRKVELNPSQISAAEAPSGPLLVSAGPGTGKTRTLVERILFLLNEKRMSPEKILALTFSNKAADEMRERIVKKAPDQAHRMTVMTFHGYALELLRKYWKEADLDKDSAVLDPIDCILMLEEHLDELDLEHLQDVHDPAARIPDILKTISKAKDELVSPARFLEMAEEQFAAARDEYERVAARKCLEAAGVYRFYQDLIEEKKLLDYSELISRAVRLLQTDEAVGRTVRAKYDAILVDEFQDINRASGVLVKEIAGDGRKLWAVGDLRQSIYRWRGASPDNIRLFDEDYPGAVKLSLDTNYRSGDGLVSAFSEFARSMSAVHEPEFPGWKSESKTEGTIEYRISDSIDSEAAEIAAESSRLVSMGIPLREQAVICRKRKHLNAIADRLVLHGVPVLFLGDLFSRPEIRDLLSFLDLLSSDSGLGLVRVGAFPEYSIPIEDAKRILSASEDSGVSLRDYLETGGAPASLSEAAREGLARLKEDVSAVSRDASAYSALCELLFTRGHRLRWILSSADGALRSQRLIATYQFLSFARKVEARFQGKGEFQIASFLTHIRKLIRFDETKELSRMPSSAEGVDALRLLTVHRSKGLEFDAVFLPYLAEGDFPQRKQGESVLAPKALTDSQGDRHYEEEECLFFVASSRARQALYMSRSEKYTAVHTAQPSRFLNGLGEFLPSPVRVPEVHGYEDVPHAQGPDIDEFDISQIARYKRCPRQFYYKDLLGLEGTRRYTNAAHAFDSVVQQTVADLQIARKSRSVVTEEVAIATLEVHWVLAEMDSRPYSKIYRRKAEDVIRTFVRRTAASSDEVVSATLKCSLENGVILVRPKHLEVSINGVLIREFTAGRASTAATPRVHDSDVVMVIAAEQNFKGAEVRIVRTHLGSDDDRTVTVSPHLKSSRKRELESTLRKIAEGRFGARPDPRECPKCRYFNICPI